MSAIGSISSASSIQATTTIKPKATPAAAPKASEESTESSTERAREAASGGLDVDG